MIYTISIWFSVVDEVFKFEESDIEYLWIKKQVKELWTARNLIHPKYNKLENGIKTRDTRCEYEN